MHLAGGPTEPVLTLLADLGPVSWLGRTAGDTGLENGVSSDPSALYTRTRTEQLPVRRAQHGHTLVAWEGQQLRPGVSKVSFRHTNTWDAAARGGQSNPTERITVPSENLTFPPFVFLLAIFIHSTHFVLDVLPKQDARKEEMKKNMLFHPY